MDTNKKVLVAELKTIKTNFSPLDVEKSLEKAIDEIKLVSQQREYEIQGSLDKIKEDFILENSTLSSRKKLTRKIYFFMKKKSLKTMSSLLGFIRKRFMGDEYKVVVKPSILEQEIISLREKYKKLYQETEQTRKEWKEKKKMFNLKNHKHDN